jgi:hypothetical protein
MAAEMFGPDDLVECVKTFVHPYGFGEVTEKQIYVCTVIGKVGSCFAHPDGNCRRHALMLREAPLPLLQGWCADLFRPVKRGDTAQLWDKLMSAPLGEDEDPNPRRVPIHDPDPNLIEQEAA